MVRARMFVAVAALCTAARCAFVPSPAHVSHVKHVKRTDSRYPTPPHDRHKHLQHQHSMGHDHARRARSATTATPAPGATTATPAPGAGDTSKGTSGGASTPPDKGQDPKLNTARASNSTGSELPNGDDWVDRSFLTPYFALGTCPFGGRAY